jgi:PAS domain S-box-containing protein
VLISVLFEATTIIYTPVPPDQSLAKAWFGYFSVFALYIFLVLLISGLKKARDRISEQRDLLQVTLSSIGDAVIATDPEGGISFMNSVAQQLTGWDESSAKRRSLSEVFNIVNEQTDEPIENPVDRVLNTGSVVGMANHTILIAKNGDRIPIDDCASPIKAGEEIKGVVLIFSDVTERKQAEKAHRQTEIMHRIVEAQEGERRRIARDLNDHLGQKMTALRLQIGSLIDDPKDDSPIAKAISEVEQNALHIDRNIGFLSWELRPTELENLGLPNALATFVREWSSQYGIAAEFHASGLDRTNTKTTAEISMRMPAVVETNLYRIVQEALNNVLKHAEATRVDVLLQRDDEHTVLIIEDNGRGLENENSSRKAVGSGLGLLGMQERAALLKGTLELDSSPGAGTTVIVRIPLNVSKAIAFA